MLVRNWMVKEPLVVRPKTSVEEALRTMRQNRVRHLPVVNEQDLLVGIITQTDPSCLARLFAQADWQARNHLFVSSLPPV